MRIHMWIHDESIFVFGWTKPFIFSWFLYYTSWFSEDLSFKVVFSTLEETKAISKHNIYTAALCMSECIFTQAAIARCLSLMDHFQISVRHFCRHLSCTETGNFSNSWDVITFFARMPVYYSIMFKRSRLHGLHLTRQIVNNSPWESTNTECVILASQKRKQSILAVIFSALNEE